MNKKKVLVAPLNWGLGHATRCMPLIDELLLQGAEVILASDGVAYELLKAEYPNLPIYLLPAYNIRYPFQNMVLSMASQMPKILRGCFAEHIWLRRFLKDNKVDIVISDNRYGFYNSQVKSIFMTHQLNIQTPFLQSFINRINHFFIKKFDECWVPDFEKEPSMAGKLSHGYSDKELNIKYLGPLSRFKKNIFEKKYKAIIVLSGPEPQRTILEKKLLDEVRPTYTPQYQNQFVLVRGLPNATNPISPINGLEIHDFLIGKELNQKIQEAEWVICRSGYSTIMDLAQLGKKAILIPTPGQTEQAYLAHILEKNKLYYFENQDDINLERAFINAELYQGFGKISWEQDSIFKNISELLKF